MRYVHVRYEKSFVTNIQKQKNMLKIRLLFKKFTTSRPNNSRILRIKNANFSGYCFYMKMNITETRKVMLTGIKNTHTYQGVGNVSFLENFAYIFND